MFQGPPVADALDALPQRGLTPRLLKGLDLVAPGEWTNPTSFDRLVREVSGETSKRRLATIRQTADRIDADPKEDYRRALWVFQTVDRVDKAIATAAVANKLGEKLRMLRFLKRLTPKSDTAQSVDLVMKLGAEAVAFGVLHGLPKDGVVDFGRRLTGYGGENLLRIGAVLAIDGALPLGNEFWDVARTRLASSKVTAFRQNAVYRRLKDLLPGRTESARLDALREMYDSSTDWISEFASSRGLSRDGVLGRVSRFVSLNDSKLDYVSAFIDASTNYFAHTGTQTVALQLIEEAIEEAPREVVSRPADLPALASPSQGSLKQRQRRELEALKERHRREKEELQLRHRHQEDRLREGFWSEGQPPPAPKVSARRGRRPRRWVDQVREGYVGGGRRRRR
ncbi:MAG: hypothetical protein AAGK22_05885 [Acidobacteriota bacterium]